MARAPVLNAQQAEREKSKRVGALRALFPFIAPYKGLAGFALIALVLTASISLMLPLAVRRVIDNFGAQDAGMLNLYFSAALVLAGLLAVGHGLALRAGHAPWRACGG